MWRLCAVMVSKGSVWGELGLGWVRLGFLGGLIVLGELGYLCDIYNGILVVL